MPRFSIVVPTYNNAEYLKGCLNSILEQDYDSWEAIVVIDASPDDSLKVANKFAKKDERFKVVNKKRNGGPHSARKSGVAKAKGDYIAFIDADDEFMPSTFSSLAKLIKKEKNLPDVIHFGLKCAKSNDVEQSVCEGFEAWANSDDALLSAEDACFKTFMPEGDYSHDWNVTHRLFEGNLCRRVFANLSDERLVTGEDGYEYLALMSESNGELVRDSIVGYKYSIGRGNTSSDVMHTQDFKDKAKKTADVIKETKLLAKRDMSRSNKLDLTVLAEGYESRLVFSLANEWFERVPDEEKIAAAKVAFSFVDKVQFAAEMARFVRDKAYAMLYGDVEATTERILKIEEWLDVAKDVVKRVELLNKTYSEYFKLANAYLSYLRAQQTTKDQTLTDVAIYVATHKSVELFDSNVMFPIQVGSNNDNKLGNMLTDDEGENIAELNPMYCELTAQYWAWKNSKTRIVGFCHYRRYFNFSNKKFKENQYGEVLDERINSGTQCKYELNDKSIKKAIQNYDVITTCEQDIHRWNGPKTTNRSLYDDAPHLHVEDLDAIVAILIEKHPEYEEDALDFLNDHYACFCNMYVMKREIFNEYCEWLFPILEQFCETADMSLYSKEGLRTPGHLAERLFNIYIRHQKRVNKNWTMKQVQCVHFQKPDKVSLPDANFQEDFKEKRTIPVVFAADNNYVPVLATAIYSMCKNASSDYKYDVVVLTSNIAQHNKELMQEFFSHFENVSLRFFNVDPLIEGYELTTSNPHISNETYYRFLIQRVLPEYDKVIYLDSDMIVEGDVSELFNVNLENNLIAAVRDIDFLGNLNFKDNERKKYNAKTLKMKNPYDYFQAGVLVLNTRELRKLHPTAIWMEFACDSALIYNDQDILNRECEGRVTYLPMEWNVMHDCGGRVGKVFSSAPAGEFNNYFSAKGNPKIIHYAGFEKPWTHVNVDMQEHFWKYARQTPYYENLIISFNSENSGNKSGQEHERVVGESHSLRKVVDPIAPIGSYRREALKVVGRAVRGRK